jgi:hypothetical protein
LGDWQDVDQADQATSLDYKRFKTVKVKPLYKD